MTNYNLKPPTKEYKPQDIVLERKNARKKVLDRVRANRKNTILKILEKFLP